MSNLKKKWAKINKEKIISFGGKFRLKTIPICAYLIHGLYIVNVLLKQC